MSSLREMFCVMPREQTSVRCGFCWLAYTMFHHILWALVTMAFLEFPQHRHPPSCNMPFVHARPISPDHFAKLAHTLSLSDLNPIINSSAKSSFTLSSESDFKNEAFTQLYFLSSQGFLLFVITKRFGEIGLAWTKGMWQEGVIIWWMSFWKQEISFHFFYLRGLSAALDTN